MHLVCTFSLFGSGRFLISMYLWGLLHWHWCSRVIAPVPVNMNEATLKNMDHVSHESTTTDDIITISQTQQNSVHILWDAL